MDKKNEALTTAADAAAFIERKADDYAREFGTNDMGSLSFGNEDMRIYHWHLVELADEIRALAAPSASAQQAEPVALPFSVLDAMRFYANGLHFNMNDRDAWDTVSGEPQNFWCDEAGTATVEDGSLAKAVLQGVAFTDGEEAEPIEGEVYTAAPAPSASPVAVAVTIDDVLAWADGVTGDAGTEHASKISERELAVAQSIVDGEIYANACEAMEEGQRERAKRRVEIGTTGSLCDGIGWLFERIKELEVSKTKSASPAALTDEQINDLGIRSGLMLDGKGFVWAEELNARDMRAAIRALLSEVAPNNDALQFVGLSVELLKALKRLSFAAQTTGGVAGRDDELVAAISEAETAIQFASGRVAAKHISDGRANRLEQDAKRYRWIRRDRTSREDRVIIDILVDTCEEYFDAAIDAAMSASKEEK